MEARDAMTTQTTGTAPSPDATATRCFAVRHRRRILIIAAVIVPIAAAFGLNVAHSLSVGGFVSADAQSEVGRRFLTDQLQSGPPNLVLLVRAKVAGFGAVRDAAVVAEGKALTEELKGQRPGVIDAF